MNLLGALLTILFFVSFGFSQSETAKFRYEPSNGIPVGTVLHYLKTNIDGSNPEHVSQFIATADRMEVVKFHPKESPAGLVIAEMDWTTFSAKKLTSWRVLSKDERTLFGTIEFDGKSKQATVAIGDAKPETVEIKHFPVHLYNFDLGSLNFALPHLLNPKKSFVIGITDPTFRDNAPMVEYKGEATVTYVADERRNQVATRKYRINGPGLQNRGGHIWINKKHGWIEDIEIDLADNPSWKSFKLKLTRTERISQTEWERFVVSQF